MSSLSEASLQTMFTSSIPKMRSAQSPPTRSTPNSAGKSLYTQPNRLMQHPRVDERVH